MSEKLFSQDCADDAEASVGQITIPGIDDAVVVAAGLRHCEFPESHELTGSYHPGILIPYLDLGGQPILDQEKRFCRIRLDVPNGDQKYHQRSGTKTHGYIVPGFSSAATQSRWVYLIEGEKKALALASDGRPAIGLSGFYGAFNGKDGFTQEFVECLGVSDFDGIVFMGDSDVLFNAQFFDAALNLSKALLNTRWANLRLNMWAVPPGAPGKGLDDVRAALGDDFPEWLKENSEKLVEIQPGMGKGRIAVRLLEVHKEQLFNLANSPDEKDQVFKGLAKLVPGLSDPLVESEIRELAGELGFSKRAFGNAITISKKGSRTRDALLAGSGIKVNLELPAGVWSEQILQGISDQVYLAPDRQLARLIDGKLVPFNEKQIIPFLDVPDRCVFVHGEGELERPAKFEKKHAEVVLGATINCASKLRPVRVFSETPILIDEGEGCKHITDYSRDHEILVSSDGVWRGEVTTAVAWEYLDYLVQDFSFEGPEGKAMLLALLFTPAISQGGFIRRRRVPFFLIMKDQKGAGGGTACQLVNAVYKHAPRAITVREPFRVHESISKSLLRGDTIVYLDNVRGRVLADLPFLESLLTEPLFDARILYQHGEADATHLVLMATSNGLTLSDDLSDRAVEIRLAKQPPTHKFCQWPEGDLLSHVCQHQSFYIACIHKLIESWVEVGRPMEDPVSGIRFKEWEATVGGILSLCPGDKLTLFPDGAIGRQRMIDRMSSPDFEAIEAMCIDLLRQGQMGVWLTARQIAELTDDSDVVTADEISHIAQLIGTMLTNFCPETGKLKNIGERFKLQRRKENRAANNHKKTNTYCIVESSQLCE